MKRFLAAAVVACGVALFAWAAPAMAQHGHGGGGHGGGGHGGGGHGSGGHASGFHGSSFHGGSVHGGNFHGNEFHGRTFVGRGWGGGWGWGGVYLGSPYYYGSGYPYYANGYPYYDYSYPSVAVAPSYYYGELTTDTNYAPRYSGTSPTPSRQSFYSPEATATRATVHVVVPDPNAKVYFDDTLTTQTGLERVFTTPSLDPAKSYTYTVRATWMENGNEVSRTRDVRIQAGQPTMVDFRAVDQ